MFEPGDQIDIWVIEKRLGAGGMGSVYRCHNKDAHRILAAIKVLESHVSQHPEARKRFIREAEILFGLEHPNIVKVRNVRVESAPPYIEMEFVRGQSIEDILGQVGPVPLDRALPQFGQIASAIHYLHARGVRHRDIKPANLLVTRDGTVKLVDFGLAMEADTTRLTQGNMSFGTVSYAPPEWVDPDRLDPVLWDLYATGVVFWEMLTGDVAFPVSGEGSARQQAFQVVMRKQNHAPLDPGEACPDGVRQVIRDLTHADPAQRIQSAHELVRRLEDLDGVDAIVSGPATRRKSEPTLIPREHGRDTFQLDPTGTPDDRPPVTPVDEAPIPPPRNDAPTAILTADIDADEDENTRRGGPGGVVIAVLVLLLLLGGGGAAVVAALAFLPEDADTREVILAVEGVDPDLPVDVMIGSETPTRREGRAWWFDGVASGEQEVVWAIGEDCEALPCRRGRCPAYCLAGWRTVEIPDGEGTYTLPFKLAAPAPRPLRLGLGDLPEGVEVAIAVEGAEGGMDGPVWKGTAVPPGRYRARVLLGTCPDMEQPCEEDCPPGCRDAVREVIVPVGDGRHDARLQVRPPERPTERPTEQPTERPAERPTERPTERPQEAPLEVLDGPRPLVTNAQFSRWLQSHPDWHREAAVQANRADANYLAGWSGTTPPAGAANQPVQHVSYLAARAYCGTRGLPQTTDPPTEWTETPSGLSFEFRMQGGSPASLESNGVVNMVGPSQALIRTGFRCAR